MTTTVQARIDENDKTQAQTILKSIGIDMSTYLNMSIKALNREYDLPFATALKPSPELAAAIEDIKAGRVSHYNNVEEMMADLDK